MTFKLKTYKILKIKRTLKKNPLIFFFHITNLNAKNWKEIEQKNFKNYIKCYKLYNTLTKSVLKKSVLSTASIFVHGSLCIVYYIKNETEIQKLLKLNKKLPFICLKLNKNLYSYNQLKNISTLNYNTNIKIFNKVLLKLLKNPYYKINLVK
jgi:ribosomal protein L10